MKMDKSLHDLIMTENWIMKDMARYKDAIKIYSEEKERITASEMGNLSDAEYLNDMARYDRMINSAEYGRDTCEKDLKEVRLQMREYIKMLMSLDEKDEKGDAQ